MHDAIERTNARLRELGFHFQITSADLDGRWCGHADKEWSRTIQLSNDTLMTWAGDWRDKSRNSTVVEKLGGGEVTPLDWKRVGKAQKAADKLRSQQAHLAKDMVQALWVETKKRSIDHPSDYLNKKGLKPSSGVLVTRGTEDQQKILNIPMQDETGEIWNLQRIFTSGQKKFHPKAAVKGMFHEIRGKAEKIYVGEGYATCLAVHEALEATCFVAFNVQNLEAVVEIAVRRVGFENVVVLADFDGETYSRVGENPGMLAAQKLTMKYKVNAAVPVGDYREVITRDFADLEPGERDMRLTDVFNADALSLHTFKEKREKPPVAPKVESRLKLVPEGAVCRPVVASAAATVPEPQETAPLVRYDVKPYNYTLSDQALPFVEVKRNRQGGVILPPDSDMAQAMLRYFGDYIVKSDGDLFIYNGHFWQLLEDDDELFKLFNKTLGGQAGYKKLRDMISLFQKFVPHAPRSLHSANPSITVFTNGTLQISKARGKWDILFRESRPNDFQSCMIPHAFPLDQAEKNQVFEETLDRLVGDDVCTKRALAQMYAACLAPLFPRLFMVIGRPGRGKSTAMLLAVKLVSEHNVSSVLPGDFGGFLAEGMIGKLVNYDTDIPSDAPLKDSVLKKVEDRAPITFNRKGRKVVRAALPPVHCFGVNQLPPTLERSVGAYQRRWTFIEFDKFEAKAGEYNKDILDDIVAAGMGGVINFALRGLRDLLDSDGHYFMKESAKNTLQKWQMDNDSVEMFLDDVRTGQNGLLSTRVKEGALIARSAMWAEFQLFIQHAYPQSRVRLNRNKFYDALRNKGLLEKTDPKGISCFVGFAAKQRKLQP